MPGRKINSNKFPIRPLMTGFITIMVASTLALAAKPEVALRGSLVYPRGDIRADTTVVWLSQLSVQHQISSKVNWNLTGDLSPATLSRPAGLRLYAGQVKIQFKPGLSTSFGRQVLWNSLQITRFDGATFSLRRGSLGKSKQLLVYAGVSPDSTLRTGYSDVRSPVAGAIVQLTNGATRSVIQTWTVSRNDNLNFYLGGSLRRRFGSRITQIADVALNITETSPEKIRLRTIVRATPNLNLYAQYRYAGQLTFNPYPWVQNKTFQPRHNLSLGGNISLLQALQVRVSLTQRLDHKDRYVTANIYWGGIMLSWQSNMQSLYKGQSLQLATQKALFKSVKIGGSLSLGRYVLFDGESSATAAIAEAGESQQSQAATCWLQGSGKHLSYRIFTQFTRNRYFKQDGRIGLQVTYAL